MTMKVADQRIWDDAIRQHNQRVFLSLLALGLQPDLAREIVQATWTRLMEKHAAGELPSLELPGLAIRQARFLALNELQRGETNRRVLAAVPDLPAQPSVEQVVISREHVDRILDALAGCPPMAKTVFRLVYGDPPVPHGEVARKVGLSLQRVRQILCETRRHVRDALEEATK
jgi:RNA polymerase sigma factor (sigma-70 family)